MAEVDNSTVEKIKTSLHGDGCEAKTLLDQMDFKDALKTLKALQDEKNSKFVVSASAEGRTELRMGDRDLPSRPNMTVVVTDVDRAGFGGLAPPPLVYARRLSLDKSFDLINTSSSPYCKQEK